MVDCDHGREDFDDSPDTVTAHDGQTHEQRQEVTMIQTTDAVTDPHTVVIKLVHTSVIHSLYTIHTHTVQFIH